MPDDTNWPKEHVQTSLSDSVRIGKIGRQIDGSAQLRNKQVVYIYGIEKISESTPSVLISDLAFMLGRFRPVYACYLTNAFHA